MSLHLLNQPSKLCIRKPVLVRSSPRASHGFLSSPCFIVGVQRCGDGKFGNLIIEIVNDNIMRCLDKKLPFELLYNDVNGRMVTIGSSHGWVATLKEDGILRLQDDLNPVAYSDPKHISLPPLVTLPHCQTQIVTNVSMSSSSPEDEDCVVAVKFLGPQISFCRPAQSNSEWFNVRIKNPCFYSSHVMFSEIDGMFRILGSGGHLIGSWDLHKQGKKPKLQSLRLRNLPNLRETKRKLLDTCSTSEHLVESPSTGETFLVKWYKKISKIYKGYPKMRTKAIMVFKLDEEGNAVYTKDIGDLCLFLSKSEPFCAHAGSFADLRPNVVTFFDVDQVGEVCLADGLRIVNVATFPWAVEFPYIIPPLKC